MFNSQWKVWVCFNRLNFFLSFKTVWVCEKEHFNQLKIQIDELKSLKIWSVAIKFVLINEFLIC